MGASCLSRKKKQPAGLDEIQAGFVNVAALLPKLFDAYGGRCAFTGEALGEAISRDPSGVLLHLAPGTGTILGDDAIPACPDAIFAFERGHLALGERYEFLVALDRISPEFLDRLNPIGRLTLPSEAGLLPDPRMLAAHRADFAAGRIGD